MSEVLTADETKKALECCTKFHHDCLKCPSYIGKGTVGCVDRVKKGALDLINRQKANAEGLTNAVKYLNEQVSSAKSEAKKEFAEELIYKIVNTPTKFESTYYMYREGIAFRQNEIIDIIKEMAGDGT